MAQLSHRLRIEYDEGPVQSSLIHLKAHTNFSPGTQFINDKAIGLLVDSMIQFYLKQTPILKSIPARSLAFRDHLGKWRPDRRLMTHISRKKNRFVIKHVDKDGGRGVLIGIKSTQKELAELMSIVSFQPELYIAQEFEHLSVLEDRIVDLRIHIPLCLDSLRTNLNFIAIAFTIGIATRFGLELFPHPKVSESGNTVDLLSYFAIIFPINTYKLLRLG